MPGVAGAAESHDEVGFVDPATGLWNLGADESFFFGVPGDIPFLGDWYGTGVDTPGLYRPSNGFAYVIDRRETGFATDSWYMGIPGDIPMAGDWDGDGTDTFSVYRPSQGKVYINNFNRTGVAQVEYFFGVPQDKPFAIDFNGDGTDDIGLHRESNGLVYMTDATTDGLPDGEVASTDVEFFWGIPNDPVFAGDWSGDGVDSPGLVRPTLARAFLRYENSQGFADEDWPTEFANWRPVVGRITGAPFRFEVELSDGAIVPGPGLPGGGGAASINVTAGGEVCFSFDLDGVTGITNAHLHEGAPGETGPAVVTLGTGSFGCVTTNTATATAILNAPTDFYIQIHTGSHPAGAVRGQLAERGSWDVSLVGANVVGLGDADGFVTLAVDVSTSGMVCTSDYSAQRISTITAISLHQAVAGQTGPAVTNLTFGPDHVGCVVVAPRSAASMILAIPTGHYVEITTGQFPNGAVRGQLDPGA